MSDASGWPTIRGPHFTGHSDENDLADAWPSEGPPVLWTRTLGKGYSSVVASEDRVFTQYQTVGGQYVLCMDADTGATIWQYRYDWAYEVTGLYPGPRSTPTVDNRRVYFTSPDALVGCLDWNGDLLWSRDLKKEYGTRGTDFGYACSPMVADGKVFLPLGGRGASMLALDAQTGKTIWRSGDESASYTPAMPITLGGRAIIVGYLEHTLCGFDLETGEVLWNLRLSRGYDEHSAWPLYDDPFLWISAPFQAGWQLFELSESDDADSVSIRRVGQGTTMSNDVSSSVLVDGYVYGFDLAEAQSKAHRPSRGAFRCIDFQTGVAQWSNGTAKERRSTDFEENRTRQIVGHAGVIVADGKLILLSDLGELILAKATPDRYTELARANVLGGEIGWATPALHRRRLYVRNHSRLVCLYLGREESIPDELEATALRLSDLSGGRFWDWTWVLGVEPEYAMDPPTRVWLVNWFWAITASFGAALAVSLCVTAVAHRRMTVARFRFLFSTLAFLICLVSGTVISRQVNDFVFTWPGCLFIAFSAAVYLSKSKRRESKKDGSRADLYGAIWFTATSGIYFLACRRLSLLTEWVFLCGFFAAVPTLYVARRWSKGSSWRHLVFEFTLWFLSWIAFYLGGVAVLAWMYEIS